MKKSKNIGKIIKSVLLSIVISYMVLNLIGIVMEKTEYRARISNYVLPITQGKITEEHTKTDEEMVKEIKQKYGENAPTAILAYAQGYFTAQEQIINMQEMLIGISIIGGIIIAIIARVIIRVIKTRNNKKK